MVYDKFPKGKKELRTKWVYWLSEEVNIDIRYQVQLMVEEFELKVGIDYEVIFSLVVKYTNI